MVQISVLSQADHNALLQNQAFHPRLSAVGRRCIPCALNSHELFFPKGKIPLAFICGKEEGEAEGEGFASGKLAHAYEKGGSNQARGFVTETETSEGVCALTKMRARCVSCA